MALSAEQLASIKKAIDEKPKLREKFYAKLNSIPEAGQAQILTALGYAEAVEWEAENPITGARRKIDPTQYASSSDMSMEEAGTLLGTPQGFPTSDLRLFRLRPEEAAAVRQQRELDQAYEDMQPVPYRKVKRGTPLSFGTSGSYAPEDVPPEPIPDYTGTTVKDERGWLEKKIGNTVVGRAIEALPRMPKEMVAKWSQAMTSRDPQTISGIDGVAGAYVTGLTGAPVNPPEWDDKHFWLSGSAQALGFLTSLALLKNAVPVLQAARGSGTLARVLKEASAMGGVGGLQTVVRASTGTSDEDWRDFARNTLVNAGMGASLVMGGSLSGRLAKILTKDELVQLGIRQVGQAGTFVGAGEGVALIEGHERKARDRVFEVVLSAAMGVPEVVTVTRGYLKARKYKEATAEARKIIAQDAFEQIVANSEYQQKIRQVLGLDQDTFNGLLKLVRAETRPTREQLVKAADSAVSMRSEEVKVPEPKPGGASTAAADILRISKEVQTFMEANDYVEGKGNSYSRKYAKQLNAYFRGDKAEPPSEALAANVPPHEKSKIDRKLGDLYGRTDYGAPKQTMKQKRQAAEQADLRAQEQAFLKVRNQAPKEVLEKGKPVAAKQSVAKAAEKPVQPVSAKVEPKPVPAGEVKPQATGTATVKPLAKAPEPIPLTEKSKDNIRLATRLAVQNGADAVEGGLEGLGLKKKDARALVQVLEKQGIVSTPDTDGKRTVGSADQIRDGLARLGISQSAPKPKGEPIALPKTEAKAETAQAGEQKADVLTATPEFIQEHAEHRKSQGFGETATQGKITVVLDGVHPNGEKLFTVIEEGKKLLDPLDPESQSDFITGSKVTNASSISEKTLKENGWPIPQKRKPPAPPEGESGVPVVPDKPLAPAPEKGANVPEKGKLVADAVKPEGGDPSTEGKGESAKTPVEEHGFSDRALAQQSANLLGEETGKTYKVSERDGRFYAEEVAESSTALRPKKLPAKVLWYNGRMYIDPSEIKKPGQYTVDKSVADKFGVKDFQPRSEKQGYETTELIKESPDPQQFDDLIVYRRGDDLIMLSGHGRLEGALALQKQGELGKLAKQGAPKDKVPIQIFDPEREAEYQAKVLQNKRWKKEPYKGTLAEQDELALLFADRVNKSRTEETLRDKVRAFVRAVRAGGDVDALAKKNFGHGVLLKAARWLKNDSPFVDGLDQMNANNEPKFPRVQFFTRWMGEARGRWRKELTDRHEEEVFQYFYTKLAAGQRETITEEQFKDLIRKRVERTEPKKWDSEEPLNLRSDELPTGIIARADVGEFAKEKASLEAEKSAIDKILDSEKSEITTQLRQNLLERRRDIDTRLRFIDKGITAAVDAQSDIFGNIQAGAIRVPTQGEQRAAARRFKKSVKRFYRRIGTGEDIQEFNVLRDLFGTPSNLVRSIGKMEGLYTTVDGWIEPVYADRAATPYDRFIVNQIWDGIRVYRLRNQLTEPLRAILKKAGMRLDIVGGLVPVTKNRHKFDDYLRDPENDKNLTPQIKVAVEKVRDFYRAIGDEINEAIKEDRRNAVLQKVTEQYLKDQKLDGEQLTLLQRREILEMTDKAMAGDQQELIRIENYIPQIHEGTYVIEQRTVKSVIDPKKYGDAKVHEVEVWQYRGAGKTAYSAKRSLKELLRGDAGAVEEDFRITRKEKRTVDDEQIRSMPFAPLVDEVVRLGEGRISNEEAAHMIANLIGHAAHKKYSPFLPRKDAPGYLRDPIRTLDIYIDTYSKWRMLRKAHQKYKPLILEMRGRGEGDLADYAEELLSITQGRKRYKSSVLVDKALQSKMLNSVIPLGQFAAPRLLDRSSNIVRSIVAYPAIKWSFKWYVNNAHQRWETLNPLLSDAQRELGLQFWKSEAGKQKIEEHGVGFVSAGKLLEADIRTISGRGTREKLGRLSPETANQEIAWATWYRMGKDKGLSEGDAAIFGFLKGNIYSQFLPNVADVPRAGRGPFLQQAFMFRRFQVKNIELASDLLADKQYRKFGRWLVWQIAFGGPMATFRFLSTPAGAVLAATAFVGLTPDDWKKKLVDVPQDTYDWLVKQGMTAAQIYLMTHPQEAGFIPESLREKIELEAGLTVANTVFYGLPGLVGVDMTYTYQLADLPYGNGLGEKLSNFLLGPAGGAVAGAVAAAGDVKATNTSASSRVARTLARRFGGFKSLEAQRAFYDRDAQGKYNFRNPDGRLRFQGDLRTVIKTALNLRPTELAYWDNWIASYTYLRTIRDHKIDELVQEFIRDDGDPATMYSQWQEAYGMEAPIEIEDIEGRLESRFEGAELDMYMRTLNEGPKALRNNPRFYNQIR